MAKDDYDTIVYKILLYLYACLKRKIIFDKTTFFKAIDKDEICDEYLADVLYFMKTEGLIDHLVFVKAWGNVRILSSDYRDMEITVAGIHYLQENNIMKQIKDQLSGVPGIIAELISLMM